MLIYLIYFYPLWFVCFASAPLMKQAGQWRELRRTHHGPSLCCPSSGVPFLTIAFRFMWLMTLQALPGVFLRGCGVQGAGLGWMGYPLLWLSCLAPFFFSPLALVKRQPAATGLVASSVPQPSASMLGGNRGIGWVARRPQAHICLSLVRLGTDWMCRGHIPQGSHPHFRELKLGFCDNPEGWEMGEEGLEVEEAEDTCTPMANSCSWTSEKKSIL